MTRADAVARAAAAIEASSPGALIVACNGMIGRELYTAHDRTANFYMIGSMGLAASIGLGLAVAQPSRRVVVFDGDGNLLMGMGAIATVAAAAPGNFYHVVFDNAAHASTGGQRTASDRVALERVAAAAGYRRVERIAQNGDVERAIARLLEAPGPAMLLVEVARGNVPGIKRVEPSPTDLTGRFRRACTSS
jgi:sulfopyruvate decarboxylase subunit beta